MRELKFRYRLRLISNHWGDYKEGDIDTFYMNLNNESNGLAKFSIDERWQIVTCDEWTGLKDKNGINIYEGDVVNLKSKFRSREYIGEIKNNGIRFYAKDFCFTHYDNPEDIFSEEKDLIEVIGNIHQNPELINN